MRVSTELQDEESQKTAIQDYLKTQKVEVIKEPFIDHALSGKKGVVRPAYNQMLEQLDEVDGICVFDWDRLTRDEEIGIMLMYLIKKAGKKVFEARTHRILTFEPFEERLLTVFKSMMAEEERKKIHARQAAGIKTYRDKNHRWGPFIKKINWKRYDEYRELGLPKTNIAKLFGISIRTLNRRLKEREVENDGKKEIEKQN